MDVKERIHRNLKMACLEKDTTTAQIAAQLGKSRQAFNQRFSEKSHLRISELMEWADILDVPLAKLLNGVGGIEYRESMEVAGR